MLIVECWGDDVPDEEITSFSNAVQCKQDETVVFSWIVWPSKEMRKSGMEKVMSDPRTNNESNPMPFNGQQLKYGGFQAVENE